MSEFWYWDKSRVISILIACCYIILAALVGSSGNWFLMIGFGRVIWFIVLGLVCIWFGDLMGEDTGCVRGIPLRQSPGSVIRFMGWILLLLPIFLFIYINLTNSLANGGFSHSHYVLRRDL